MKIAAVVSEFNPFHNGHKLILEKAREITNADYVITVMSGNFVQRGEPAVADKWLRTEASLDLGCDLVLELPVQISTSSAEFFALGAVNILNETNIVTDLVFGAEANDINLITQAAEFLSKESEEYKNVLGINLSKGMSYPSARHNTITHFLPHLNNILTSPNNILAIEYMKALIRQNSTITPHVCKRVSAPYHSTEIYGEYASATAIRNIIVNNIPYKDEKLAQTLPDISYRLITQSIENGKCPVMLDDFSDMLNYKLRHLSPNELKEYADINEGLENRIYNMSALSLSITELANKIKSKRYTYTHVQRALLHILLEIKKEEFDIYIKEGIKHIRVLGFRKECRPLIKSLTDKCSVPLIFNVPGYEKKLGGFSGHFKNELQSTDIYSLCYPNANYRKRNLDFTTPIIIK